MSRRVDAIHFHVVTTNRMPPTTQSTQPSVMPISASVMPAALRIGRRLGPGRWISSPTGGGVCSGLVIALRDVDGGSQEGGAEHEDADRRGDQGGADVPAGEATVHEEADPIEVGGGSASR